MNDAAQSFDAVVQRGPNRRAFGPLPFAPDETWGVKTAHHVAGTINSMPVRAVIEALDIGFGIAIGPIWRRDRGVDIGDRVVATKRRPDQRAARIAEVVSLLADGVKQRT